MEDIDGRFLSRPELEPWDSDPRLARVERDLEAAPALTVLVEELGVPEYTEDSRLEEDTELVSK